VSDILRVLVVDRLASSEVDPWTRAVVLAAFEGADRLDAVLGDGRAPGDAEDSPAGAGGHSEDPAAGPVWLTGLRVEGFRGVAPALALELVPGPGLVLVTGRNGSGKSSLAEAAELALSGTSDRAKTRLWAKGLVNLHHDGATSVELSVRLDGQGDVRVGLRLVSDDLAGASAWATRDGDEFDLGVLGWRQAVGRYRPVLTYGELAQLSAAQPSALYDPLNRILGLEALTDADAVLRAAASEQGKATKAATEGRSAAVEALAASDDPRAEPLRAALTGRAPDTDAARALLAGQAKEAVGAAGAAPAWAALTGPAKADVESAAEELTGAIAEQEKQAGTTAGRADRLAALLRLAVESRQGPADLCPVCGQGTLDEAWLEQAGVETDRYAEAASGAADAQAGRQAAAIAARRLVTPVPPVLTEPAVRGADPALAVAAWRRFEAAGHDGDDAALGRDLPGLAADLTDALAKLAAAASVVVAEQDREWQPLAERALLAVRLTDDAGAAAPRVAVLKNARTWLKDASEEIRNDRLRPFADQATGIWEDLRQDSNVSLSGVTLTGQNTHRSVDLELAVDGVPGPRAVLSQGELAALGLALFLPRSVARESPFRFVVVDDPVQSFDPSKVDGLARVLHGLAADRQVVVFTHDERLSKSLRHQDLHFTHYGLDRGERSVVTVVKVDDPVLQHLKDADALAKDTVLPTDLLALAVAGYCRDAVEDAAVEVARRRLLAGGKTVEETDDAVDHAGTTRARLGLAVLGDARAKPKAVNRMLLPLGGTKAFLDRCVDGVHDPDGTEDLPGLLDETRRFVGELRASG
jgi:energy-coupling factor transporter ATP-binding protein EcfA2